MKADEFLTMAGQQYNENRKKWGTRLKKMGYSFSDDIYNDTILKVYDKLNTNKLPDNIDIVSYWYKSFLTNTKRYNNYSYIKDRDDTIDVLKYLDEFPTDDNIILLTDYKDIFKEYKDTKDFHLFLIYHLTDMTYKEIEDLTNIKDVKYKIRCITNKLNDRIKNS